MPLMNDTIVDLADLAYRKRAEALLGVDDLVSDIIDLLEEKGILDETYSAFEGLTHVTDEPLLTDCSYLYQ